MKLLKTVGTLSTAVLLSVFTSSVALAKPGADGAQAGARSSAVQSQKQGQTQNSVNVPEANAANKTKVGTNQKQSILSAPQGGSVYQPKIIDSETNYPTTTVTPAPTVITDKCESKKFTAYARGNTSRDGVQGQVGARFTSTDGMNAEECIKLQTELAEIQQQSEITIKKLDVRQTKIETRGRIQVQKLKNKGSRDVIRMQQGRPPEGQATQQSHPQPQPEAEGEGSL